MDLNTTPQHVLSRSLGLSDDAFKKLRDAHLMPGADWLMGKPIQITDSGIKKIRAALNLPPVESPDASQSSAGVVTPENKKNAAGRHVALTVLRPVRGNTLFLLCTDPDGRQVRLRVGSNLKFTPGMRVPTCVPSAIDATLFQFEGRLPRWRGRF
jgi:hypothetical protein